MKRHSAYALGGLLAALVLMVGLFAAGGAAAADVALVIGNRDYRAAADAPGARRDAREVAEALRERGYRVILGLNLDRREMADKLKELERRIDEADRVVVYYSGLALHGGGHTWLAPVDQRNDSLVEVVLGGVPLDLVLRLIERKRGRAVLFIDAAYREGFRARSHAKPGLGKIEPPEGVLVVSAAPPGEALARRPRGEISPFARTVVERFLRPGRKVRRALRDLPPPIWTAGRVRPGLSLVPRDRGPLGEHELDAVEREAALGLTRTQRREVQRALVILGYDPRGVDGIFGPGTRRAIRAWQRDNELPVTGYLDREQLRLLRRQAGLDSDRGSADDDYWARTGAFGTAEGYRSYLARYPEGRHAAEAREQLKRIARAGTDSEAAREFDYWRRVRRSDRPEDYRAYLERYPTGIWKPEAEARLAELSAAPDPARREAELGLTRSDRLSVEQRLAWLGFPPGPQDGFFDADTRWAIRSYQESRGYQATGYLDRETLAGIMRETREAGLGVGGAAVLLEILRSLGQ